MSDGKMPIIGITGGIGSGKSEAAKLLATLGAVHINADKLSRDLTAAGGEALHDIREKFGDRVFRLDGTLDRRALGAIIFDDTLSRRTLEGIIHPRVQRDALKAIEEAKESGAESVVLDVPLLFETGMDAICDVTWTIEADADERVRRVMLRDGLPKEQIEKRMETQMSDSARAERATKVIRNDTSVERFKSEITSLYNQLMKAYK